MKWNYKRGLTNIGILLFSILMWSGALWIISYVVNLVLTYSFS